MAGPIVVSGILSASNTDVLQGTRLQTVPRGGFLTFEIQADLNDATNNYTASIQMPNGDTPMNAVSIPGTTPVDVGILDDRQKLQITVPVQQGGHTVFSVTESGTAVLFYRVTYSPA